MTFEQQLAQFRVKLARERKDILAGVVTEVKKSVQEGSALTGSPGQPVDTGFLRGSWQAWYEGPDTAVVGTNVSYAPAVESGLRQDYDPKGVDNPNERKGPHRKSTTGGPHSVGMTRQNFDRIVESVVAQVASDA